MTFVIHIHPLICQLEMLVMWMQTLAAHVNRLAVVMISHVVPPTAEYLKGDIFSQVDFL